MPPRSKEKSEAPWKGYLATVIVVIAILGSSITALGYVFATKEEVQALKLEHTDAKLRDWRIQSLEVRTQNMEVRTQRLDTNVVLLMNKFEVKPTPEPKYQKPPIRPQE